MRTVLCTVLYCITTYTVAVMIFTFLPRNKNPLHYGRESSYTIIKYSTFSMLLFLYNTIQIIIETHSCRKTHDDNNIDFNPYHACTWLQKAKPVAHLK